MSKTPEQYVARKRLHMGSGVYREVGEPVPETATWRSVGPWVRSGAIRLATSADLLRWEQAAKPALPEEPQVAEPEPMPVTAEPVLLLEPEPAVMQDPDPEFAQAPEPVLAAEPEPAIAPLEGEAPKRGRGRPPKKRLFDNA